MKDDKLTWEIDEFQDRDLVLAEVELDSPSAEVTVPDWLRPHLVREVTDDSKYSNYRLACDSGKDEKSSALPSPQPESQAAGRGQRYQARSHDPAKFTPTQRK